MRWMFIFLLIFNSFVFGMKKTFIVGVENINYFPYYSSIKNNYKGASREILDAFAKSKNYKFIYKPLPIKRLYAEFLNIQHIDFKYPDNPYWKSNLKKNKKIYYSKNILPFIDGTIVKRENIGKKIKILGTVSGFTPWDYLDKIKKGEVIVEESKNLKSLLINTVKGFFDGAYVNVEVAKYIQKNILHKSKELVFDSSLPYTKDGYKLSTIKYPEIIKELNEFLKTNQRLVEQIKIKYEINLK